MADSISDMELLRRLSKDINTIFDCTQLAIRLDLDDNIVTREEQQTRNPNAIAFAVLKEWKKSVNANRRHLHNALHCDTFCHLARKYQQHLL